MTAALTLDTQQIMAVLPHRPPFLLVDRIVDLVEGERAVGVKQVTINEPFFAGHFPGYPVMPGVLIVEALAQVGAVLVLRRPEYRGKTAFFAGIDGVRFRRQVTPGDSLRLEVIAGKLRRGFGTATATATVDGQLVCQGELMFAIGDAAAAPA
jgi:3-hydroxyacyl-[acyl-carrier-protein] dehydratase